MLLHFKKQQAAEEGETQRANRIEYSRTE